jgi:hypothetical protein
MYNVQMDKDRRFYGKAKDCNTWIWHSILPGRCLSVRLFFVFRSQAIAVSADYLSTLAKGELGISGDTGIMRFIFWTDNQGHNYKETDGRKTAGPSLLIMEEKQGQRTKVEDGT